MRKRTLLVAAPLLLATITGGFWASGILPGLLGLGGAGTGPVVVPRPVPGFVELPEIVSNLNAPGRRAAFVRLRAKLEISDASQAPAVQAAMPRLIDLFATYLREVRPEELRGSAGTHRLREELIARAGLAVAGPVRGEAPPVRVTDVLFLEILIQ
jgi:flagellar FliL protein